MEPDIMRLLQIFQDNKDVPFVERLRNRQNYPAINNSDGSYSTHKMMWMSGNDGQYVFPSIVFRDGQLRELPARDAFEHAMKTKDFIRFETPEEADWFGKNYKRAFGIR